MTDGLKNENLISALLNSEIKRLTTDLFQI